MRFTSKMTERITVSLLTVSMLSTSLSFSDTAFASSTPTVNKPSTATQTGYTINTIEKSTDSVDLVYNVAGETPPGDNVEAGTTGDEVTSEPVTTQSQTTQESTTQPQTTEPATTATASKANSKRVKLAVPKLQMTLKNSKSVISWNAIKKAGAYKVYSRPSYEKKYTRLLVTKRRFVSLSRFKKSTLYNVKVRAIKKVGSKTYYSKFQKKPFTFLTKTSSPKLTSPSAGSITISWEKINKAKHYVIQYSQDKNFETDTVTLSFDSDTTQTTVYDLPQGKTYYARILFSRKVGITYTSKWSSPGKARVTDAYSIIQNGYSSTNGFFKDSLFIGDSVMLGFSNYMKRHPEGYLDGAKVYGIGSYSLIHATNPSSALHPLYRGQKMSPEYLLKQYNAKKVFLFFGINDVCTGNGLEGACSNYRLLINNIKRVNPDIEIYVISATYTLRGSRSYELFHPRLHALNKYMREYCANNGYHYIDIASYLSDSNGDLKPEYCSDGFLHETWAAYEIWDKVLRAYASNSK